MGSMFKKIVSCAFLSAMVSSTLAADALQSSQSINSIVAIVNNTPIMQSQVNELLQTAPDGADRPTEQMAIEALVNQTLQLDIAQRAGIKISDAEVDQAIVHIAAQNQLTLDQLKAKVTEGMSWSGYQKQIKDQMIMNKIQQQAVAGKVNVSNAQIQQFIQDHADQLGAQSQYQYSDLLIPTSDQTTSDQAMAYGKTLLSGFKSGMKLENLEKSLPASADASMIQTDVSQTVDEVPDVFLPALNALKPGELSAPITTGNGVHILQLDQKQIASPDIQKQKAVEILMQQAFLKAVKDWVNTLKKSAYIEIFPSQDTTSAS